MNKKKERKENNSSNSSSLTYTRITKQKQTINIFLFARSNKTIFHVASIVLNNSRFCPPSPCLSLSHSCRSSSCVFGSCVSPLLVFVSFLSFASCGYYCYYLCSIRIAVMVAFQFLSLLLLCCQCTADRLIRQPFVLVVCIDCKDIVDCCEEMSCCRFVRYSVCTKATA